MKAIVQTGYGSAENLAVQEIDKPTPKDKEVLVKVHAASIHAGDRYLLRGDPYLTRFLVGWPRPRSYVPGYDLAGTVEAVGRKVEGFKPGDEVFGAGNRTCAEYVCVPQSTLLLKPESLSFVEAATLPTSATTALLGLRDSGKVEAGQKVLITGASGGVGTFAVQIAKAMGAEVTGVCSTKNLELVESIGADHVVDYTKEDFTEGDSRYDLILDQVADHSLSECRKALSPEGVHIPNSGNRGIWYMIKAMVLSLFLAKQGSSYLVMPKSKDLADLSELTEAGKLEPVIDRTVPLSEARDAFAYLDKGHARGKVVITMLAA